MPEPEDEAKAAQERSERDRATTASSDDREAERDRTKADRCGREKAWEELCGKLAGGASPDPALILCQAMAMSGYAASQADALMFYNAVANQQKTNILGMSVTAKCVRYMFEVGQTSDDEDIDVLEEALWPLRSRRRAEERGDGEL